MTRLPSLRQRGLRILGAALCAALSLTLLVGHANDAHADGPKAKGVKVVDAEKGGVDGLKATFQVNQPRSVVYDLLSDVNKFAAKSPNVLGVKVLKSSGNTEEVWFKVDAVMSKAEYVLKRTKTKGEKRDVLTWDRIRGDAKVIRGSWTLTDGSKPGTTRVVYQSYVDVAALIPTSTVRSLAKDKVHEMVIRLRLEASKETNRRLKAKK